MLLGVIFCRYKIKNVIGGYFRISGRTAVKDISGKRFGAAEGDSCEFRPSLDRHPRSLQNLL